MAQQPLVGRGFLISEALRSLRHATPGGTPLGEWSARRRDLYLTTHNTHKRRTSVPPARFKPAVPASDRPHTNALDRAAAGIGFRRVWCWHIILKLTVIVRILFEWLVRDNIRQSEFWVFLYHVETRFAEPLETGHAICEWASERFPGPVQTHWPEWQFIKQVM
jgi:hypothetical protein